MLNKQKWSTCIRNSKDKLLRTNTTIWFNKVCKTKHLAPKYAYIRIKGNNPWNMATKKAAICYRNDKGLKFLYKKKQELNDFPHETHFKNASHWQHAWHFIQITTHRKLNNKMNSMYENLSKKLNRLQTTST
jgi:hypothetical protein